MPLLDHLWRAEEILASDPDADLFAAVPALAAAAADDLAEVAALQLSRGGWSAGRIRDTFARYRSRGLAEERLPDVVRLAYRNRVADGTAGSWDDLAPLGLSPDGLRLGVDGECGWLGQVVRDRYRLDERLGRGALAVVYRAWDLGGGEAVALKLPAEEATAGVVGPLFRAEADATGRVAHPRVPRVLASHPDDPLPVLVIQLVAGRTLARWQGGRAVPPPEAAAVVGQLLDALAAAHDAGVVHRDPSPANVLVDGDGRVWLTDWNASLREDESARRGGEYAGTPGYASQEGLFGLTAQTDPRSDLWSAGAVLYELLAGRRLAAVASREEAVVHNTTFDPATLPFPDAVPEGVRRVCRKALHPNPALRYATAADFARDLAAGREAERRLRWADVFELGHLLGRVRYGWVLFQQHIRNAGMATVARDRLHAMQTGVAQVIQADQTLGEAIELAAAVGMTLASDAVPDWLATTIYRPRDVTPDWPNRLAAFAAAWGGRLAALDLAAEAQFVGDEMRMVFRLGRLLACVPASGLRATLTDSPLLGGFPAGVRRLLAELFDELVAATPDPADVPTLFPRRVREWIAAHDARLAG